MITPVDDMEALLRKLLRNRLHFPWQEVTQFLLCACRKSWLFLAEILTNLNEIYTKCSISYLCYSSADTLLTDFCAHTFDTHYFVNGTTISCDKFDLQVDIGCTRLDEFPSPHNSIGKNGKMRNSSSKQVQRMFCIIPTRICIPIQLQLR